APTSPPELTQELARADRFITEFPQARKTVQERIRAVTRAGGKFAMLGAGHLSAAFINLYGLERDTEFVADDHPKESGLFTPGPRGPIRRSSELVARNIKLCLMTVRAEVEDAVVAKNQAFTDRGGILASVFPESRYAFDKLGSTAEKAA